MIPAEDIVAKLDNLPPFPEVARKVMELAKDPDAGAEDIFRVIQYDQSVTANCLKVINSSYFGMRRKVSSLRQAVALLGTENLVKMVLVGGGANLLAGSYSGYGLDRGALWRHSVTCAIVSQLALRRLEDREDPMLFTAALLHDVGKVVLDRYVESNFEEIVARVKEGKMSFLEAEGEVLGVDHAQLGGMIAESWGFPESLVIAIRLHHNQGETRGNSRSLLAWVRLANLISNMIGVGTGHDGMACRVDKALLDGFDLKQRDVQEIMAESLMEMGKAEDLMEMTGHN